MINWRIEQDEGGRFVVRWENAEGETESTGSWVNVKEAEADLAQRQAAAAKAAEASDG